MPSIYQPRRPRASPLWQLLTAAWETFLASYEKKHRPTLGPLRPNVFTAVRAFLRCGDLASGFLRFRAGSFEWQAIGELREAKNALRSLGEEGPSATKSPTANSSSPSPKSCAASSANDAISCTSSSKPPPFFASVPEASNGRPSES